MRKLEGEQVLMRIFIGESDQWERRPLYMALIELFRRHGLAGATVLKGVAGFGARSLVHTVSILRLSADLPRRAPGPSGQSTDLVPKGDRATCDCCSSAWVALSGLASATPSRVPWSSGSDRGSPTEPWP